MLTYAGSKVVKHKFCENEKRKPQKEYIYIYIYFFFAAELSLIRNDGLQICFLFLWCGAAAPAQHQRFMFCYKA